MSKSGTIDLTTKKNEYKLTDKNICSIQLDGNIKVMLLENEKGVFVDIRRFFNEYPTKKGVRIDVKTFKTVIDSLKSELDKY